MLQGYFLANNHIVPPLWGEVFIKAHGPEFFGVSRK